jgi:hypothetical protein
MPILQQISRSFTSRNRDHEEDFSRRTLDGRRSIGDALTKKEAPSELPAEFEAQVVGLMFVLKRMHPKLPAVSANSTGETTAQT